MTRNGIETWNRENRNSIHKRLEMLKTLKYFLLNMVGLDGRSPVPCPRRDAAETLKEAYEQMEILEHTIRSLLADAFPLDSEVRWEWNGNSYIGRVINHRPDVESIEARDVETGIRHYVNGWDLVGRKL